MGSGTLHQLAYIEIIMPFLYNGNFKRGLRMNLDEIYIAGNITDENFKKICKAEADRMAYEGIFLRTSDITYIFYKDEEGRYGYTPLP